MNWDALETPLEETPEFFIEPADSDKTSELQRVVAFRRALHMAAPTLDIVAVPNAGRRGQKALNQARSEGAVWGFPDLMVIGPSPRIAFLEFKAGRTMPKQHQVARLNRLRRLGYPCGVFRTADAAVRFLHAQGFPFMEAPDAA